MKSSYLNLLGLAFRAGKCSLGEDAILRDIRSNRAKLVLLACDIGVQTKKKLTDKSNYYQVPVIVLAEDREALSNAIGKSHRVAVAVNDAGFAKKIRTLVGE